MKSSNSRPVLFEIPELNKMTDFVDTILDFNNEDSNILFTLDLVLSLLSKFSNCPGFYLI